MSPFLRWIKFNLVGLIGVGVQLSTLALLNHVFSGHYLFATAGAIEITLLHNFVWHTRYTWRDRGDCTPVLRRIVRFHLANGLVSLLGNLALTRLLVHGAHLPLLLANAIAIVTCSAANFCLSDKWAFGADDKPSSSHFAGRGEEIGAARRVSSPCH